jgi:hypothetical protein
MEPPAMNRRLVNFAGVLLVGLVVCAYGAEETNRPAPPSPTSTKATQFGYTSPEAAVSSLRERSDVVISQQGGWTIVDDKANFALWAIRSCKQGANNSSPRHGRTDPPLFRMQFEHTASQLAGGAKVAHGVCLTGALAFLYGLSVAQKIRAGLTQTMRSLSAYGE